MEPCGNNKAAVLSLIVRLPTGNEAYAPSGQAGKKITFGSYEFLIHSHNSEHVSEPMKLLQGYLVTYFETL